MDAPEQKNDRPPFQLPALIAALLAAALAAVSLNRAPIPDSNRPPPDKPAISESLLVDARLWEDPLESLPRRDEAGKFNSACKPTDLAWPSNEADDDSRQVALVVIADEGRSSEDRERRIRARAAVLAALNRWGYEPDDPEHLAIRCLSDTASANPAEVIQAATVEQYKLVKDKEDQQRASRLGGSDPYAGRAARARIYWIGDSPLRSQPSSQGVFTAYARQLRSIVQDAGPDVPLLVLGPLNRDVADALSRGARCNPAAASKPLPDCSDDFVPAHRAFRAFHTHPGSPTQHGQPAFTSFELGHTDGELAHALITELELRGLNVTRPNDDYAMLPAATGTEIQRYACLFNDHVALLNEWDTQYARDFRRAFASELGNTASGLKAEIKRWETPNLHGFAFTRGLDGKSLRQEKSATNKDARQTKDGDAAKAPQADDYEQSNGTSQRDYVRRLAEEIAARDAALKASCRRDAIGIHAIGILGSDFYDKLMLLQTLRARFPNTLFFTTGLDARLLDRQNTAFTRNLIIASQFDTALAPAIQRYIIPFRDSGQSALFLASSLALLNANVADRPESTRELDRLIGRWSKPGPRVFEIGLAQTHPLNPFSAADQCRMAASSESADNLFGCLDVHPPRTPLRGGALKSAVALIFVLIAVYLLGATVWAPAQRGAFFVILGAGMLLLILPLAIFGILSQLASFWREEPLAWLDGVSIWPGLWLRWVALILGLCMLALVGRLIMRSVIETGRQFDLTSLPPAPLPTWRHRCWRTLQLTREILQRRLRAALLGGQAGAPLRPAQEAWVLFKIGIAPGPQSLIGCIWAVLVQLVIFRVWYSHPSLVPIRGPLSTTLFTIVATANGFFFLLLLFLSLSTALRLKVLARDLSRITSNWPSAVVAAAKRHLQGGFCRAATIEKARWEALNAQRESDFWTHDTTLRTNYDSAMDIYIDISLLASVSRGNEWVLYMPGALLSLILASRWSYFDAWTLDPVVLVILTLFAASALLTVMIASSAGRRARSAALQELDSISAGIRTQQENLAELIRHIRAYVGTVNDGIFRAGQWNLLRALILPIASATGLRGIEVMMNLFQ